VRADIQEHIARYVILIHMPTEKRDKTERMREIKDEIVNATNSPLYTYRKQNGYSPVIGEGNHNARIVFIGEAPGRNEAEQGKPFCGAAGKILDELLASVQIKREDVYVTNIVKDRPPHNRDPLPEEIAFYAPFLDRQIDIIQPKLIATLGRFSMEYIMNRYGLANSLDKISKLHGKVFEGKTPRGTSVTIAPLYHPAVAIYNRTTKDILQKDFQILNGLKDNDIVD